MCCSLYAGNYARVCLFAGGVGRVDVLDVPEVMLCELLCMPDAAEGELCLLEAMRCV